MEKANKFFFLSNVNSSVVVDFRRFDDQTVLTFCHSDDKIQNDKLVVSIRTRATIDHASQQEVKEHFVSYEMGDIQQGESLPIRDRDMVWTIVEMIVNDVFKA